MLLVYCMTLHKKNLVKIGGLLFLAFIQQKAKISVPFSTKVIKGIMFKLWTGVFRPKRHLQKLEANSHYLILNFVGHPTVYSNSSRHQIYFSNTCKVFMKLYYGLCVSQKLNFQLHIGLKLCTMYMLISRASFRNSRLEEQIILIKYRVLFLNFTLLIL